MLLSNITNPAFDYIALGHIHKSQVLYDNPPVVYSGSLERVDFGEEDDEKGFYVIELEPDRPAGQRLASLTFHQVTGRRFLTVSVTVEARDADPTSTVLRAIAEREEEVKDAIVRLQISLPAETEGQIRDNDIRGALKEAYYYSVAKDIRRENRLRLGQWTAEEITPLEALKTYLESKKVSAERTKTLLEYGERLIREQRAGDE